MAENGMLSAIEPTTPVGIAAPVILWSKAQPMFELHARAASGEDADAVHDMRVASRRTREALSIFAPLYRGEDYDWVLGVVRRVTRALGPIRDADVFIEEFAELISQLPGEDTKLALAYLIGYVAGDRAVRVQTMKERLHGLKLMERRQHFELALHSFRRNAEVDHTLQTYAGEVIPERLDAVIEHLPTALVREAAEEQHRMRIDIKHLRYAVETFKPVFAAEYKPIHRVLTEMQDTLGNLHDRDVFIDLVRAAESQAEATTAAVSSDAFERVIRALDAERDAYFARFRTLMEEYRPQALRMRLYDAAGIVVASHVPVEAEVREPEATPPRPEVATASLESAPTRPEVATAGPESESALAAGRETEPEPAAESDAAPPAPSEEAAPLETRVHPGAASASTAAESTTPPPTVTPRRPETAREEPTSTPETASPAPREEGAAPVAPPALGSTVHATTLAASPTPASATPPSTSETPSAAVAPSSPATPSTPSTGSTGSTASTPPTTSEPTESPSVPAEMPTVPAATPSRPAAAPSGEASPSEPGKPSLETSGPAPEPPAKRTPIGAAARREILQQKLRAARAMHLEEPPTKPGEPEHAEAGTGASATETTPTVTSPTSSEAAAVTAGGSSEATTAAAGGASETAPAADADLATPRTPTTPATEPEVTPESASGHESAEPEPPTRPGRRLFPPFRSARRRTESEIVHEDEGTKTQEVESEVLESSRGQEPEEPQPIDDTPQSRPLAETARTLSDDTSQRTSDEQQTTQPSVLDTPGTFDGEEPTAVDSDESRHLVPDTGNSPTEGSTQKRSEKGGTRPWWRRP